ncbi:nucleoside transporter C-terminal domain-containing protein, partial [Escherichia coli]|uniref:nucleoside transporter C-terminal domain-containing protein n=1 Tax=Escherichia coli TaxID=562 RepID=UPI002557A804
YVCQVTRLYNGVHMLVFCRLQLWSACVMINMGVCLVVCGAVRRTFGTWGGGEGAFSAVAPHRAPEIAQLGLRALAAATLSNLMSATIAGFFIGLA